MLRGDVGLGARENSVRCRRVDLFYIVGFFAFVRLLGLVLVFLAFEAGFKDVVASGLAARNFFRTLLLISVCVSFLATFPVVFELGLTLAKGARNLRGSV